MSSPAITTGTNANLSRRQTCRVQTRHDAAVCTDALGCASRLINARTRRHGAYRRGAAVPRAQVELVSVRRTRLPLVSGWARWKVMHLTTNQGASTGMPIVPIEGKRERGRRRRPVPEWSRADISIHDASPHGCVVSGLRTAHTHRTWDMGEMWSYREPLLGKNRSVDMKIKRD